MGGAENLDPPGLMTIEAFRGAIKQLLTRQPVQVDEELITDLKILENYCKDCIPKWYEKIKRARQLLARQPQKQVTREWIEKELNAHLRLEDEALRDYVHVIADIIVEIFTAFGIEVVK